VAEKKIGAKTFRFALVHEKYQNLSKIAGEYIP
jgi:hypothetical protein